MNEENSGYLRPALWNERKCCYKSKYFAILFLVSFRNDWRVSWLIGEGDSQYILRYKEYFWIHPMWIHMRNCGIYQNGGDVSSDYTKSGCSMMGLRAHYLVGPISFEYFSHGRWYQNAIFLLCSMVVDFIRVSFVVICLYLKSVTDLFLFSNVKEIMRRERACVDRKKWFVPI